MTKADLVERVTAQIARTAGPMISKKDCARVVDAFLDAIKEALQEQKNIEVRGFGTFKIRHRKTRMARNPRTGSPVEVSARPVPVFKPSKELRAMVAGIDVRGLRVRGRRERPRARTEAIASTSQRARDSVHHGMTVTSCSSLRTPTRSARDRVERRSCRPGRRLATALHQLRALDAERRLPPSPLVAVNERYARLDQVLHPGDEVAVIPPVAGG